MPEAELAVAAANGLPEDRQRGYPQAAKPVAWGDARLHAHWGLNSESSRRGHPSITATELPLAADAEFRRPLAQEQVAVGDRSRLAREVIATWNQLSKSHSGCQGSKR